jgi:hypothetical protein
MVHNEMKTLMLSLSLSALIDGKNASDSCDALQVIIRLKLSSGHLLFCFQSIYAPSASAGKKNNALIDLPL